MLTIKTQKDKHYTFEDPRATTSDPAGSKYSTQEWLASLEQARDFFLSNQQQSGSASYASDTIFNGLNNSSLSSPADSLGGDGAMPSSAQHHLRQTLRPQPGDNGQGDGKGKKRFSKRHSKSGLAAVF